MQPTCMSTKEDTIMRTTPGIAVRELDRRTNDGIDVRLLWRVSRIRVNYGPAHDPVQSIQVVCLPARLTHPFRPARPSR
jgi:hypothetical protein